MVFSFVTMVKLIDTVTHGPSQAATDPAAWYTSRFQER
jgi:hypothetical protein